MEIIDRAKLIEYQQQILKANYDMYSKSIKEFTQYLECLEVSSTIDKIMSDYNRSDMNCK